MRTPGLPLSCFRSMQFLKTNTFQGSVTTLSVYDEMYIMCISIIANFMLCNSQKLKKTVNIR